MSINDQHYIELILKGNTDAFSVLVNHYNTMVFTLVLRMIKHKEEAEEVAQDTFVKVYMSLHKFKGDCKFSTWIYKIAYNTCLDRIKKNKKFYSEVPINEFTEHQVKSIESAFDLLESKEKTKAIKRCINLLPSDDGFLLTLFYFEEQSLDEIAQVMNLTSNNVKVKLFRARQKLASILKENLEPELIESYERSKP